MGGRDDAGDDVQGHGKGDGKRGAARGGKGGAKSGGKSGATGDGGSDGQGDARAGRVGCVLAAHSQSSGATPGSALQVDVDRVLVDGEGGLLLMDAWHRSGRHKRAARGERLVLVDGGRLGRRDHPRLMAFGKQHGASLALDPACAGWPSSVALEEGLVGADDVVCALDPEAGALGGLGTVVLRTTPDGGADLLQRRFLSLNVPEPVGVSVDGRLKRWVGSFEVALAVLAAFDGAEAVRGRVVELSGSAIDALCVDDRMGLCATLARAGVAALVPPDEVTRVWLAARQSGTGSRSLQAPRPRVDVLIDGSRLAPAAIETPWPGKPLQPGGDDAQIVTQVILGGRLADLRTAALALAERPLSADLQLSVIPASRRVLVQALEEGLVTMFVRAGAAVLPPGSTPPTAPRRERRVTTLPTGATDLLCGPAVAGASALAGRLVDPETIRREVRRRASMR